MSYLTVALLVCVATLLNLMLWLRARNAPLPTGTPDLAPPRLGGVAIALSALLVGGLALVVPIGTSSRSADGLWPVLVGGGLVFLIGWLDDRHPLPPLAKLAGQVVAALTTWILGVNAGFLPDGPADALFTVFCLVGGANALNLIDGLDGLAGGVALIASGTGFFLARNAGQVEGAVLAAALAGGSLAFLWFNLPPARVYMGDAGSNFLGFGLGALPLLMSGGEPGFANFSATMLLLGVPIVETATSIGRRLVLRRSPLVADLDHIHHRLLRQGWSVGAVLALAHGVSLLLAAVVLFGPGLSLIPLTRAILAWLALGALLVVSSLFVLIHAGRLPGPSKR